MAGRGRGRGRGALHNFACSLLLLHAAATAARIARKRFVARYVTHRRRGASITSRVQFRADRPLIDTR